MPVVHSWTHAQLFKLNSETHESIQRYAYAIAPRISPYERLFKIEVYLGECPASGEKSPRPQSQRASGARNEGGTMGVRGGGYGRELRESPANLMTSHLSQLQEWAVPKLHLF